MSLAAAYKYLNSSSPLISWKSTGKLQQTVANCIERTGRGLHSGHIFTVKILPAEATLGRYFAVGSTLIRASIHNAVHQTPLCTVLRKDGYSVQTVEHLLSALEVTGVDNCRIEIQSDADYGSSFEVPIFDGSSREWADAIDQVGVKVAVNGAGERCEKLAPYLNKPVHLQKNDTFIAAFPDSRVNITYGINFPQAPAIGRQWFSSNLSDESFYSKQIASSRTFCIYEEVEYMRSRGLIKGGSTETAIICSMNKGWLNPPLHFDDEPCRHKILDLVGDISLLAQDGSQGLLVAHIIAYKFIPVYWEWMAVIANAFLIPEDALLSFIYLFPHVHRLGITYLCTFRVDIHCTRSLFAAYLELVKNSVDTVSFSVKSLELGTK